MDDCPVTRVQAVPPDDCRAPFVWHFGEHIDPRSDVLAAFCVMRGGGKQRMRPASRHDLTVIMKPFRTDSERARVAADLVQRDQAVVFVKGGVFDAFSRDRSSQLLELHDKFATSTARLLVEIARW